MQRDEMSIMDAGTPPRTTTILSNGRAWEILFLAFYAAAAAAAIATDFLYFADGSFFAFALGSGHSWEWLFSEFPLRLGALGLTGLPAAGAHAVGASHWWVGKIYQASFFAIPLLALWSIGRFADAAGASRWRAWSVSTLATLGMSSFGFPTETWVSLAFFWPVLASVSRPLQDRRQLAFAAAAAFIFVFSYEAVILCAPAVAVAWLRTFRGADPASRTRHMLLGAVYMLLGAVWIYVFVVFQPKNPLLIAALKYNVDSLAPTMFLTIPLAQASIFLTGIALAALIFPRMPRGRMVKAGVLLAVLPLIVLCLSRNEPTDRYVARAPIMFLLPVLGLALASSSRSIQPTRWLFAPALLLYVPVTAYVLFSWVQYRDFLLEKLAPPERVVQIETFVDAMVAAIPDHRRYYWSWATPYTIMMLRSAEHDISMAMIRDTGNPYRPTSCTQSSSYIKASDWLSPPSADLFVRDICERNPL
jgi:hypothetical protein